MVVVYAHKTTTGWSSLIDSLRQAKFTITEAWPIDTERSGRLRGQNSAALASSIFTNLNQTDFCLTRSLIQTYPNKDCQPLYSGVCRDMLETGHYVLQPLF